MERWILRDEILKALNQWYLIFAAILIGAAVGFGVSYLKPAPYQAIKDIYVGIDVKRVNEMEYIIPLAEEEPLNLDDYKNWQLKQVADILTASNVLGAALEELQSQDPYWKSISLGDLQNAVDIYWYDTGTWRLEVTLPDKDNAIAGVETWMDVGHREIARLLEISQAQSNLDQQIWSVNLALADLKLERAKLITFSEKSAVRAGTLGEGNPAAPLSGEEFTALADWLLTYQDGSAFWEDLVNALPAEDQPTSAFLAWLDHSAGLCDAAVSEIEAQLAVLNTEREDLLPDYHEYLTDSLGLSANLVLLPNTSVTEVSRVYNSTSYALGGAFLGILAWLILTVVRIRGIGEKYG